jgi:type IX secretion system PorP/SprF family membrane protein
MILFKQKFYYLFIFFVFTFSNSLGQDGHFSQFYANPLYLNPAFTGTVNCPRFSINFRDQWPGIPGYLLSSVSYDQHINALHGGIGALVSADVIGKGIFQTYNAGLIYNFRVRAANQFNLQFAVQANYLGTVFNWEKLQFASELIAPYTPNDLPSDYYSVSKSQIDAGVGMVGYTPYLYFGLAVHHLLPVQANFLVKEDVGIIINERIGVKWTAHLGGKITLSQKERNEEHYGDLSLHPNIIFMSQKTFHYLHEGFYFKVYPFTVGAWLRHDFKSLDAFIVSMGVEYKFFRIGYSYDFNISQLERTGGAHEISLQFVIPCRNDKMDNAPRKNTHKFSPVACPKF